ncbi:sulfurtransferase [Clostridium sediminicola]|uniref:sulfurtransferase n=1 Tax=Clostridium sediminicola TaxID=3114879 RepID=UPI0031F1CF65
MKYLSKFLSIVLISILVFTFTGCSTASQKGEYIIDAKAAIELIKGDNVVIVDTQKSVPYSKEHVKGSVNIARIDIVKNDPFTNMLANKDQFEKVMNSTGISNDSTVIIYDTNDNMDSARLWWSMRVYGHENVKVVSGGLEALRKAGAEITSEKTAITKSNYTAKEKNQNMIATLDDVKAQINDPSDNVVILDTRSLDEFNAGTIPSSVLIDYAENNYIDGTYKSIQDLKILYLENDITPDNTVMMYCKTSIRGAQTYLALYNAGYENLKLYDGAWVEWSSDESLPVQTPVENKIESNEQDNS